MKNNGKFLAGNAENTEMTKNTAKHWGNTKHSNFTEIFSPFSEKLTVATREPPMLAVASQKIKVGKQRQQIYGPK